MLIAPLWSATRTEARQQRVDIRDETANAGRGATDKGGHQGLAECSCVQLLSLWPAMQVREHRCERCHR